MPIKVEYSDETVLTELFEKVWQQSDFSNLRDDEIKVQPCFCIRTQKDGEAADPAHPPVKLKKVDDAFRLFMPGRPHYVLIVDYAFWDGAQGDQQESAINRALCSIEVGRDHDGKVKVKTNPPEFSGYFKNVARYGGDRDFREAFDLVNLRVGMRENVHRLLPHEEGAASPPPPPPLQPPSPLPPPVSQPVEAKVDSTPEPAKLKPPKRGRLPELRPDEAAGE